MKNILTAAESSHFILLYGSQLGQAQSIAEGLVDVSLQEHELKTAIFPLNDVTDIKELTKIKCPIVIITSTTGDGDPPENADKFWRKLRRKTLDSKTLLLFRYTILGLGDTNFNNFCNCGKTIHGRLQDLGATLFYPPGWADDGTGLELVVDDWIQGLWPALKSCIGINKLPSPSSTNINSSETHQTQSNPEPAMPVSSEPAPETKTLTLPVKPAVSLVFEHNEETHPAYNLQRPATVYPLSDGEPVLVTISSARLLTKSGSLKTAVEVTLKLPEEVPFEFLPGDSIGVASVNHYGEVSAILEHLGLGDSADKSFSIKLDPNVPKGKVPAHVPVLSTPRDLLTYCCDIRTPAKKAFLRLLAESCSDDSDKSILLEWCSKQGAALYTEKLLNPGLSLLDLLLQFPSCKPKLEGLVEHLPRLQPRAYSICSSPLKSSTSFEIAFNIIVIPKEEAGRQYSRSGVCTGWFYDVVKTEFPERFTGGDDENLQIDPVDNQIRADSSAPSVVIYRRKNQNFRLPQDTSLPVIMVGPGTGVAPFIGFLQHRELQKLNSEPDMGSNYLYFGCRNREKDYLYEEELNKLTQSGLLTKLYVSFSRDETNDGIKYVQDWMRKNQQEVVTTLMDNQGYFYVCGDARNMAKNVRETLIACLQDVRGADSKEAMAIIADLVSSKRYLQDVWA